MNRWLGSGIAGLALLFLWTTPASAAGPENVQDLGPEKGQWSLQYVGQFGNANGTDEGREHSGQSFYGLSDALAVGGETLLAYRSGPQVEDDRLYFEYDSIAAIVRFSDPEKDAVGTGLWLQAGLDQDGELARLEARFIVEKKTERWWSQANLMFRRINEEDEEGTHLAYAARLSRAVGQNLWLGLEASGQAVRIAGFGKAPFEPSHYLGPSLGYELPVGKQASVELGLSYLRRIDHDAGLRSVVQLSAELQF